MKVSAWRYEPSLKSNMRLLLNRMHLQVLSARDMIVSKVATVDTLYRYEDTRSALCNIFSEPSEVYENGGSFSFNDGGRIWTTKDNCSMRLLMTPNHLACAAYTHVPRKGNYIIATHNSIMKLV